MGDMDERAGEKQNISLARALIYRLLARSFSYPDLDLLGLFDPAAMQEQIESWGCTGVDASEELAQLGDWLNGFTSEDELLRELEKEYTRLFVNALPRVPVPPYSSLYLDSDGLVWGRSTAQAARLYEAAGLHPAEDFHDIPDHVAAELEFVSHLIVRQHKDAPGIPVQVLAAIEQEFLHGHLLRWAPVFFARVEQSSRLVFYRVLALLGRRLMEVEAERLSEHGSSQSQSDGV